MKEDLKDKLDIRYSELSDEPFLLKWLLDPSIAMWYPPSNESELKAFVTNWIGFSRFKCSLTAIHNNEISGIGTLFLMPYKKVSHHCLFYLIVDPLKTKNGIGSSLLKNILNLAQNYFRLESISAEVFEGCPIINLLKNFSFNVYATQEKYVKDADIYRNRILYDLFFERKI